MAKRNPPTPGSRKCHVCDAEVMGYSTKCVKCGAKLQKKRTRSAPTNEKRLKNKQMSTCSGNKNKYKTRGEAQSAAKQILKTSNRQLRVYRCEECRCWHLTKYHS